MTQNLTPEERLELYKQRQAEVQRMRNSEQHRRQEALARDRLRAFRASFAAVSGKNQEGK